MIWTGISFVELMRKSFGLRPICYSFLTEKEAKKDGVRNEAAEAAGCGGNPGADSQDQDHSLLQER